MLVVQIKPFSDLIKQTQMYGKDSKGVRKNWPLDPGEITEI